MPCTHFSRYKRLAGTLRMAEHPIIRLARALVYGPVAVYHNSTLPTSPLFFCLTMIDYLPSLSAILP